MAMRSIRTIETEEILHGIGPPGMLRSAYGIVKQRKVIYNVFREANLPYKEGTLLAAQAYDRYLVNAQVMFLAERLRYMQNIKHTGEYPDGCGGVFFELHEGVSLASWGEDIKVHIFPYNDMQTVVEILSKCALPTQIIDWGKNSQNIQGILTPLFYGLAVQKMM